MKQFLSKMRESELYKRVSEIISGLSISEKVYFYILCAIFIISGFVILNNLNSSFMINEPANGGYLREGIVGTPRFINPVLAISDVDRDLSSLIYSGLIKIGPNNILVPDLALNYVISDDGLTYTFTIRDDAYFSNGINVTADDVVFTINKIQDGAIKSPKRPAFYDIVIEKINDKQIKFNLKKPYSPFLENLTVGILPKSLWDNLNVDEFSQSDYNLDPIGSGPYKINDVKASTKNMVTSKTSYELIPFNKYVAGRSYIDKFIINFYKDEKSLIDAYNNKEIEAMSSISPDKISTIIKRGGEKIKSSTLPRVFGVFFNQNQSEVLALKEVRKALDISIDKQKIVEQVLSGYGNTINSPIPEGLIKKGEEKNDYDPQAAIDVLSKAGWVKNSAGIMEKKISKTKTIKLVITISTLNSPDLVESATLVKEYWEKIGASVNIKQFDFGDLQQNIIRPRKFEALLYGMVIGRDMDFFAFWHSSQRNDPGLNISMYANSKVDKLLEDARKTSNESLRIEKYSAFENEIKKDIPAVFLYSPDFVYVIPNKIKNLYEGIITLPYERFLNINNWYIETNNLWKIFN